LLVNTLKKVKELSANGEKVFSTPYLGFFLNQESNVLKYINSDNADERKVLLDNFSQLDDNDIIVSAKVWAEHNNRTLAILSRNLITRKLFKIELQISGFSGRNN